MKLRNWRDAQPSLSGRSPRFRFPWARLLIIGVAAAAIGYVAVPAYTTITADGLIDGDLAPVVPIYTSRINQTLVACNDSVRAGQPVAVISNFLLEAQYAENREKSTGNAGIERIAREQGLRTAHVDEEAIAAKLDVARIEARKRADIFRNYSEAFKADAVGRVQYESARADAQAARADVANLHDQLAAAQIHTTRVAAESSARITSLDQEAARYDALSSRVRAEVLRAPFDGSIVECAARQQQVVAPGTALYRVFDTQRAYALVFFNPTAARSLHRGDEATVDVPGLDRKLHGRIATIYPALQKLPDALTKYFWQHEQWNEYRPVKITFEHVAADLRRQIVYNAQVRVAIQKRATPWSTTKLSFKFP